MIEKQVPVNICQCRSWPWSFYIYHPNITRQQYSYQHCSKVVMQPQYHGCFPYQDPGFLGFREG